MTKNEIIKEAVTRLVEQFDPERIILFGSHARGTADERSDFDFLVIKRDAVHNRLRTMTLMDHALRGLGIAKERFIRLNGHQVWICSWSAILLGTAGQLVATWCP